MEGDDDEEDIDDIEHEFNIDDEKNKTKHVADMLHGKMSYGRGHDSDEHSQFPPVIAGVSSRPVSKERKETMYMQGFILLFFFFFASIVI